jgi:hypothetical protein
MKTYRDGIQDAIDLLKILSENSIDYIIDRLQDYQYADLLEQERLAKEKDSA